MIVPVSIYQRNAGLNLEYKYIADTDLWYRLIEKGETFICVRKVVAGYTMRPGQLSSQSEKVQAEGARWLILNALKSPNYVSVFLAKTAMNIWNCTTILQRIIGEKKWRTSSAMKAGGFGQ